MLEYRSFEDMNRLIIDSLEKFNLDFDLIVGVPRSGMIPASLLALNLNLPLMDLDTFTNGGQAVGGRRMEFAANMKRSSKSAQGPCCRVLIIDDSVASGRSMSIVKDKIARMQKKDHTIIYAAVFIVSDNPCHVDIWLEKIERRLFEWNIMNHVFLKKACVDIDGVLCRDPSVDENDDGPKYQHFLETVSPLCRPYYTIGWLVTARLEKYRAATEQWLERHQISYEHLIMLDLPSKQDRIARRGCHAEFKAKMYRKTGAELFIESSYRQAIQITRKSRKPVFCYETRQMLYHDCIERLKTQESIKLPLRRAVNWTKEQTRNIYRFVLPQLDIE